MLAWIAAGNESIDKAHLGSQPLPFTVQRDFHFGLRVWRRYLRQTGGEADAKIAEAAASSAFRLMELGSTGLGEIEAEAAEAARSGRIAGRHQPTLLTLSNVAIYEYFNGEFAAGDRTARRAAATVPPATRKEVLADLNESREFAEFFRGQLERAADELRRTGAEALPEPLKAFANAADLNTEKPSDRELRAAGTPPE
jgi:hypothetical protein